MAYEHVIYEKKGHIAIITLNRPQRLNAFNVAMRKELWQVWHEFEGDEDAWVAIVTGAGDRAMCTGIDVREAAEREAAGEQYRLSAGPIEQATPYRWGPLRNNVSKPVIAAINGMCAGGGLDFATEADIVICSENAEFFDPHVSIGWVSAHEMIQMSRRIPFGQALRMALMGNQERMGAQRAYEVGLVSQVVPLSQLMTTAMEIAEKMVKNGPLAVRGTKLGMWRSLDKPLDEAELIGNFFLKQVERSEDHAEGPKAFAEKRAPQWKAR